METKNKIIIAILVIVIIILSGAIISTTLFKEETKTVELFENGTTIEVPLDTVLKSHDEFSTIYITDKNTTIISINNNNLAGALVSKILSTTIVEAGTKQDNGLYKLDKNSVMEIGDKLGLEYDENNIIEGFIGIKHNNTVNQSIIIIGIDEQEILNILNSIQWKQGSFNETNNTDSSSIPLISSNDNAKYTELDLQAASEEGYYNGYSDGYDDYYNDYDYYTYDSSSSSPSSSDSGGSSDSGNVEVTADDYY